MHTDRSKAKLTGRLKIAILTEIISNRSGARAPLEIAKQLSLLGHTLSVYGYSTRKDATVYKYLEQNGVKVVTYSNKPNFILRFAPNPGIIKSLVNEKPDLLIFCSSFQFFISAIITRIPILRIYMGTQFDAYLEKKVPEENINLLDHFLNLIGNFYVWTIEFIILSFSSYIIAISDFAAKEVERLYRKRVDQMIYLGGNHLPQVFYKYRRDKVLRLLSVSRITPYKGFHLLIESIKNFKDSSKITLTIVGTEAKKDYVLYLKKIKTQNVKIILNIRDKQLAKLYAQSDIYVTADRYLFLGLPIVEAAFMKKPSIVFDYAAAKEVVMHDTTGFIVHTPQEFKKVLSALMADPKRITKMGNAACREAWQKFDWYTIAKQYSNFLLNL